MTERPRRDPPIQFRPGPLAGELAARTHDGASEIARRDLARYYALLRNELRRVELTESEALAIAEACREWIASGDITPWSMPAQVDQALHESDLADRYAIDGAQLVRKLWLLSHCQRMAIVDAVERYWLSNGDPAIRLLDVGLVRRITRQDS